MSSRNPRSSGGRVSRQLETEDGYPHIPQPKQGHFGHLLAFLSVIAVLGFGFWAAFNTMIETGGKPAPKAEATSPPTAMATPAALTPAPTAATAVGAASKVATGTPAPRATSAAGAPGFHEVQPGDTLFGIARRYDTTVDALMAANGITDRERMLRVGERLKLP